MPTTNQRTQKRHQQLVVYYKPTPTTVLPKQTTITIDKTVQNTQNDHTMNTPIQTHDINTVVHTEPQIANPVFIQYYLGSKAELLA